jgi:phage terminase small subunit
MTEFAVEGHHHDLLASACLQLDRAAAAAAVIAIEGVTTKDRFGQTREHPAVTTERNAHLAFCRLQRELGLDVEPAASRPPARPGTRN